MFRASSAHLQEVNDVNCTCMYRMSGWLSKHVEELNFM